MSKETLHPTEQDHSDSDERPWDALSKVEFAGDRVDALQTGPDKSEREIVAEKLAVIRSIIDTEAIARKQNPDGLEEAKKKDKEILDSCDAEIADLDAKIAERKELESIQNEATSSGKSQQLKRERDNRNKSIAHKTLSLLHIRDKKLDKIDSEIKKDDRRDQRVIQLASDTYEGRREEIEEKRKAATYTAEFISNFERPLKREEKDRLLTFDTLSELSTDEYLKLWRHLNPQYISHVTRQGYRDHSEMPEHSLGLGKMMSNFTDLLKNGKKLRSSFELKAGGSKTDILSDDETFQRLMENCFPKGIPDELLQSENLSPGKISVAYSNEEPDRVWRDRISVHAATNNVANALYGAESGNEIFFVFPTDTILSQCSTSYGLRQYGSNGYEPPEKDATRRAPHTTGNTRNNDTYIYSEESLPIDAGFVFLPKDILVNPNTGSKYHDFNSDTMVGTIMTKELGGIPAREYWEKYFNEHPEEKPAHIIYYNGEPRLAVEHTLVENGIYLGNHGDTSDKTGDNLGFDDKIATGGTKSDLQLKSDAAVFYAKAADYIRSRQKSSAISKV